MDDRPDREAYRQPGDGGGSVVTYTYEFYPGPPRSREPIAFRCGDAWFRRLELVDRSGRVTVYECDEATLRIVVTTPDGRREAFGDEPGLVLLRLTDPDTGVVSHVQARPGLEPRLLSIASAECTSYSYHEKDGTLRAGDGDGDWDGDGDGDGRP